MIWIVYSILCLIWGSTWIAIKFGLDDAPPFWLASFRFLLAALILFIANRFQGSRYPSNPRELARLAIPGIFMFGLSYLFVYWSEVHIDSALTSVLFASFPFFVAAFSVMMIPEERLGKIGWIGLVIGFSGIILIFYESLAEASFVLAGSVLAIGGAASSAFGTVYIRAKLRKYDISMAISLQMTIGAVIITLAAFIFEPIGTFNFTAKSVCSVLYLALVGTVGAFLGYYWLLKRIKTIHVSLIAFITPILAILIGNLLRGEILGTYATIGTVLILGGILLIFKR